jgi:alpha-aminoadipate carrier protein LysW
MARGFCPECDAEVGLGKTPKVGQKVTCSSCGAYLEVIETSPIELDWAYEDEEEFEFDDEMYEEEDY